MVATAAQAVMDEATAQFTPYLQTGVPIFGGDSVRFLDRFNLRRDADAQYIFAWGGRLCYHFVCVAAAPAAGAGAEIVSAPYGGGLVGSLTNQAGER